MSTQPVTQPTNPFGGGQTGHGGSAINGPTTPAGQFGGNGKVALITLGGYFNALAAMLSGPLHIEFQTGSFTAVGRDQGTLAVDKQASITDIRQFEREYSYQFSEPGYPPLQDTPPVELQANFVLAAAPDAIAMNSNVAAIYTDYINATTYQLALQFLEKWFGQNATQGAERLAAIGLLPPTS